MAKTASYVEFDLSLPLVGYVKERTEDVHGFEKQSLGPRQLKSLSFKGSVGEIEGYGTPFGALFNEGSLTLGESAALFNAYLLARRGLWTPTKPQKEYLDHLFDRVCYGNILQTVVDFNNGKKSKPAKEGYKRVLVIDRPKLVVKNGIITKVEGGQVKPKLWPKNGYVGRSCDGSYDTDGVPFETWETREQAEQTWLDVGADRQFAQDAVSYSWSRNEGDGIALVVRRFFYRDDGRFYLSANWNPDSGNDDIGRVPLNR